MLPFRGPEIVKRAGQSLNARVPGHAHAGGPAKGILATVAIVAAFREVMQFNNHCFATALTPTQITVKMAAKIVAIVVTTPALRAWQNIRRISLIHSWSV
jgi:hypothetical protein